MTVSMSMLERLRDVVRGRLSEARFAHTLGVERAVVRLGRVLLPDAVEELRVAALLHDITKEYSEQEHMALLRKHGIELSEQDRRMPALLHSCTAPLVIERDFPEVATPAVLSAVACHTAGKADMSVFDKILYISDYIEDGRTYSACVQVRTLLFEALEQADVSPQEALNAAVLRALDNTIISLVNRSSIVSEQAILARNALLVENFRG